jgi:hypothetical protein
MKPSTIRGVLSDAQRWEWTDRNPAESAKPPITIRQLTPATSPDDVAKVIAEARTRSIVLGEPMARSCYRRAPWGSCAACRSATSISTAAWCTSLSITSSALVSASSRTSRLTRDSWLAIAPGTCALIATYLDETSAALAAVGVELRDDAYLFSNDPARSWPWNPDLVTYQIAVAADAAGVELDIKGGWHYTPANSWPAASTCATPPPASAAAAAAPPHFGSTPTQSPRSTGAPPHTSRN